MSSTALLIRFSDQITCHTIQKTNARERRKRKGSAGDPIYADSA
jgi:hypothetical protein